MVALAASLAVRRLLVDAHVIVGVLWLSVQRLHRVVRGWARRSRSQGTWRAGLRWGGGGHHGGRRLRHRESAITNRPGTTVTASSATRCLPPSSPSRWGGGAEELTFRGVLWGLLRRDRGARAATVLSSVLFGLWHVPAALGGGAGECGRWWGWRSSMARRRWRLCSASSVRSRSRGVPVCCCAARQRSAACWRRCCCTGR